MSLAPLLELQSLDTRLDQLAHQRESLPERQAVTDAAGAVEAARAEIARLEAVLADAQSRQRHLEGEAELVAAREKRDNDRLYDGSVSGAGDLASLQREIAGLTAKRTALEDEALEAMEEAETAAAEIETARRALVEATDAHADALEALTVAEAHIDAELVEVRAQRDATADGLDDDAVADYEKLRARLGGVAVAAFEAGSCGGCHLRLPATEIDRIGKAGPDDRIHCEQCGALLVKPARAAD